jgi:hypothetical protein
MTCVHTRGLAAEADATAKVVEALLEELKNAIALQRVLEASVTNH